MKQRLKEQALEKARQQEAAIVEAQAAIARRHAAEAEQKEAVLAERVALAVAARLLDGAGQAYEMLSDTLGPQTQEYGLEMKTIEAAERTADGEKVDAAVQEITGRPAEERRPRRRTTRRTAAASEDTGPVNASPDLPPVGTGTTQGPRADDRLGALGGWPADDQ